MIEIWGFLQKLYWDAYELPSYYLGIKEEKECHIFTILFLLFIILYVAILIKISIEVYHIKKKNRELKRRIDKLLLGILEEKDIKKNI